MALNAGSYAVSAGGPGDQGVTVQEASCSAPAYVLYIGSLAEAYADAFGNSLFITVPELINARTYRFNLTGGGEKSVGRKKSVRMIL